MKIIKYITFALIILNLPAVGLAAFGPGMGSGLSLLTLLMLLFYYALVEKTAPNWWIISIAILYFMISGLQFTGLTTFFIYEIIKFFTFLIAGYELAKNINKNELFVFLLIGSLSIGLEALFLPSDFGRYAGFYINPNVAGFICIYSYAIVFSLKNTSLKLLGQFVFTLMGLLTFSRTFIVIWLLLNLISLKISFKNIRIFGLGFLIFSTMLLIDQVVGLNNPRFQQLKNIVSKENNVSTEEISQDSRTETWALFYDDVLNAPLFGNGYGQFSGKLPTRPLGAHNTYLMIIGEAGILPFLLFLTYIGYLFYKSFRLFDEAPFLIMQTIALAVFLLANHNFFTFYYMVFTAMWIQYQIYKLSQPKEESLKEIDL
ncbi:O-antigen ligase family protein [uncultured Winogradskyella sp.]|uniref:O-antigen ligase family protein n=1 Tax=uncultured Winogradskyella sp. TaxID=395353 RepID=UPI0035110159